MAGAWTAEVQGLGGYEDQEDEEEEGRKKQFCSVFHRANLTSEVLGAVSVAPLGGHENPSSLEYQ